MLDPEIIQGFTLPIALGANVAQVAMTIVLYITFRNIKKQSQHIEQNFVSQMNIEKNSLTFTFADWIASEVKYYSPLYTKNKDVQYILPRNKIDRHLTAIGRKIVTMCNAKTVDVDILKDEIERLILTLDNMENEPTHVISDLKKLL